MKHLLALLLTSLPLAAADWPVYKSLDGRFTIALLEKVTIKKAQNRYPFGLVTITAHTHTADKDTIWRVATHDYPAAFVKQITPAKLMDVMARGMAKNINGKLTGPKPIQHGKHAGVEFQAAESDGYTVHGQLFTIGSRVYQLTLVTKPLNPALKQTKKFFGSFKPTTN